MNNYDWKILSSKAPQSPEDIVKTLLETRNIKKTDEFLNPLHPNKFMKQDKHFSNLVKNHAKPVAKKIQNAIKEKRPIVIHGDYDVDGQTATTILWRTIHNDIGYKKVYPYIPNRFDEGYGLSSESLQGIISLLNDKGHTQPPLLITVDCGIVSNKEIDQAKKVGFEVIVTDHHEPLDKLPEADEIVHTTKATGAGIAWIISNLLSPSSKYENKYLDLAALGTIADLQPLTEFNRSIVTYGLKEINDNPSEGIKALKEIGKMNDKIDTYEVGWQIGPRLNATGRLENAMDSLRLLSTDSPTQAKKLATKLDTLNRQRQDKTQTDLKKAIEQFEDSSVNELPPILLSTNDQYHEGIIGLIAGKLTQTFHRPSIVIAIDNSTGLCKGSCRSIKAISIIDTLRGFKDVFKNVGGHDMAAGFTIQVEKIAKLEKKLQKLKNKWPPETFRKELTIDCELETPLIAMETYSKIIKLKPFGIGNHEPVFMTKELVLENFSIFGQENKHLKLFLTSSDGKQYTGLAFGKGDLLDSLTIGNSIDVAYNLSLNTWNDKNNLELKIRDIKS